jgi:hypothetical protein
VLGLPESGAAQPAPSPRLLEGPSNTAVGQDALASNTDGTANTASGAEALFSNTTGGANTASGFGALRSNIDGSANTASGGSALYQNISGFANTASGDSAMYANLGGFENTAVGASALFSNTDGIFNTAAGVSSLIGSTGSNNTAVGHSAGANATTGFYNVYLGAQVTGDPADAHTIRIGLPFEALGPGTGQNRTFVAGIYGTQLAGPAHLVVIDANGQLGTQLVPPPASGSGTVPPPQANALQRELQREQAVNEQQRALIADLRARLARLEQLVTSAARRK